MGDTQLTISPSTSTLCSQLCAAANRLLSYLLPKRAKQPSSYSKYDSQTELEQRLNAMRQALNEQALQLQMVVHDLRVPLTSIQGYTELLQQGVYGSLSDEQLTVLKRIEYSSLFLDRLVSNLLDTALVERHSLHLVHEAFDPRQLAQKCWTTPSAGCPTRADARVPQRGRAATDCRRP